MTYYLQNCKAILFEKNTNHTKYKYSNVPSHLFFGFFWVNFNEANDSFLCAFLLLGETDFQKERYLVETSKSMSGSFYLG